MTGVPHRFLAILTGACLVLACRLPAAQVPPSDPGDPYQVLISVPQQRLAVVYNGQLVARYPVSTSRFGTGDNYGSYRTPLGELRVCGKIGEDLSPGAVIRHRSATGEVLPVNAPGRDPIVTREIWLDGLEPQNHNARSRCIYIHGTPEEKTIGMPVSWGCIRMRSSDVIKVFNEISLGTVVSIIPDKLPKMHRYEAPKQAPPAPPSQPTPAPEATPETLLVKKAAEPHKTAADEKNAAADTGEKDTSSAARLLKGSILLANLVDFGRHHDSKTGQAGQ